MTISEPEQGFKRARESDNEEITEEPATPSYLLRVGPFGRRKGQGDAKKLLESKGIQDLEDVRKLKGRVWAFLEFSVQSRLFVLKYFSFCVSVDGRCETAGSGTIG